MNGLSEERARAALAEEDPARIRIRLNAGSA